LTNRATAQSVDWLGMASGKRRCD